MFISELEFGNARYGVAEDGIHMMEPDGSLIKFLAYTQLEIAAGRDLNGRVYQMTIYSYDFQKELTVYAEDDSLTEFTNQVEQKKTEYASHQQNRL